MIKTLDFSRKQIGNNFYNVAVDIRTGRIIHKERWDPYENTTQKFKKRVYKGGYIKYKRDDWDIRKELLSNMVETIETLKAEDVDNAQNSYELARSKVDKKIKSYKSRRYQVIVTLIIKDRRRKGDVGGKISGRSRASPTERGQIIPHNKLIQEAWENALGRLNGLVTGTTDLLKGDESEFLLKKVKSYKVGIVTYQKR